MSQIRTDDYSLIGSYPPLRYSNQNNEPPLRARTGGLLGSLVTTTVFLRRARPTYTIIGGAALGVAGGVLTHVVQSFGGHEQVTPNAMIEEAKEAMPMKRTMEEVKDGKAEKVLKGQ